MKFHKAANIFPLLEGEEYDALVQDIKLNGLIESIVTYEDKILDGRNRFRACGDAGKKPRFRTYKGKDPFSYVISTNLHRRHLTVGQRAFLALEILPELKEEAAKRQAKGRPKKGEEISSEDNFRSSGRAKAIAAKKVGISKDSVNKAEILAEVTPDLAEAVKAGEISLGTGVKARKRRRIERMVKDRKQREGKRTMREHPKVVKEYLDATKVYADAVTLAIVGAERDRFSPEAGRFIVRRHNGIRESVEELEKLL